MLGQSEPIGFIPVTDGARARAFYVDALGLALRKETPFAIVVVSGPLEIRLTLVPEHSPAPFTVFGWSVGDIEASLGGLAERGVEFVQFEAIDQMAEGIWTSPGGARIAWFKDPDGNLLSLTQEPKG